MLYRNETSGFVYLNTVQHRYMESLFCTVGGQINGGLSICLSILWLWKSGIQP